MYLTPPVRLESDMAVLRSLRPDDAADYAAAFVEDPDLGRRIGTEADPDAASVRQRIARETDGPREAEFFQLAIADPISDAFHGSLIVHSLHAHHRRGEVGLGLVPRARRRGIGAPALSLAVTWLFEELDLLRVEMTTTPDNPSIPALARKLGFTREGLLRARNVERGQRVDVVWFGLLREEWRPGSGV